MRGDAERLDDMREAAERAIRFTSGRRRADLERDDLLLLGLVKSIEIVGEAAAHLSEATKARFPDVPWPDVIAMRHRLVHGYFAWNHDIVWDTATRSLPELLRQLGAAR